MLEPTLWTLRVSSTAKDKATVFARKHQFAVGAPVSFDEAHPRVTALEYVLGAYAADLLNGLRAVADRRRIAIDAAEATVSGRLAEALAHVGVVGVEGSPAISRIEVKLYVRSLDDEPAVREAWTEALQRSPLHQTLAAAVELKLELKQTL
jgi:uncharacterized OsmC-like protein